MLERRIRPRNLTYIGARIFFNKRQSTVDCLVRNLSDDGAKIVLSDSAFIPSEFEISIANKGESRVANIAWRRESQAGIRFLESARRLQPSLETSVKIRALEAEREMIARRVAQLSEPA